MRRTWRAVTRILAAIGFLFLLVTLTPLTEWWARELAGPWLDPKGDTLIVLGGSMLDRGVIGQNSYWRGVYAVRAYRDDSFRRVVVSGGTQANPVSAAVAQFMVSQGVPPGVITIETGSTSTRENATNVALMLRGERSRKVLLTSDFHMYRAARAFAKAGLAVTPRPFPDAIKRAQQRLNRWPVFLELGEETVKIVYYYARGWI